MSGIKGKYKVVENVNGDKGYFAGRAEDHGDMDEGSKFNNIGTNGSNKDESFDDKVNGWYKRKRIVSKRSGESETKKPDKEDDADILDDELEKDRLRFGWGRFKPDCLQVFNTIRWYVFWTCVFSLVQGFLVNGVINAIITTLEKRFDLPSSKSGLIASSNDFLALFLVLFISFYGSRRHKPRLIAVGVVVLGIGSFIFSLPHFTTGTYSYAGSDLNDYENVCRPTNGTTECIPDDRKSNLQNYLYVFMFANALHGAGSTPLFTLGTTYIDENSKAEQTPLFLGIIYCVASLGVAAGYIGGGQFLNIYTDVDRLDKAVNIKQMDPRWVGAWWIPFLSCGVAMFLIAMPIFGYPRRLPGSKALQLQKKSEVTQAGGTDVKMDKTMGKSWKDFPKAMLILLKNPTFLFLSLSACAEGMIISGVATFGAKFLQEKFNLPAAFAGFVMGLITVPGAGGGMLLGGFIVKNRKLKCKGIIRMNLICAFLALLMGCVFLLQCPTQSIAGVTTEYIYGSEKTGPNVLDHPCNVDCACSAKSYEPVCGFDGSIYFTPCHAGCNGDFEMMMGPMGPFKMYQNCSCVAASMVHKDMSSANSTDVMTTPLPTTTVSISTGTTEMENVTGPPIGAFQGICMSDCQLLYVVAPLMFVGMMLTFMTCSPTQTATLRCVQENQRSLAIGFQWLFLRLLGTMPGPVMLGTIMDSACDVWQDACGKQGNCWIYEKTSMGIKLFIWWCCVKIVCMAFYFAAQYFYKPPLHDDDGSESSESDDKKSLTQLEEDLECRQSVI